MNTYSYALENPLRFVDPEGHEAVLPIPGLAPPVVEGLGAACAANPFACVGGAGLAGYGLGSLIYPHIAIPLGDIVDSICRDESLEEKCDYQYYEVDIPVCRAIARKRGKAAAARCYATAAQRYAACLKGDPLPELDSRNN